MAWRFDGQSDYAIIANHDALSLSANGSFGGWVYRTDDAGTGVDYVWMRGIYGGSPSWYLTWPQVGASYARRLRLAIRDGDGRYVYLYANDISPGGAWHHVIFAWNSDVLRCFLNGVLQAATAGLSHSVLPINPSGSPLYIARDTAGYERFPGYLAEWALWDRTLSAGEIAVLAAGKTPDWLAQGLAWYLPMRDKPVELVRGIPTKLIGAREIDHPRRFQPASQSWAARAQGVVSC